MTAAFAIGSTVPRPVHWLHTVFSSSSISALSPWIQGPVTAESTLSRPFCLLCSQHPSHLLVVRDKLLLPTSLLCPSPAQLCPPHSAGLSSSPSTMLSTRYLLNIKYEVCASCMPRCCAGAGETVGPTFYPQPFLMAFCFVLSCLLGRPLPLQSLSQPLPFLRMSPLPLHSFGA
jgi:hypothetical protein